MRVLALILLCAVPAFAQEEPPRPEHDATRFGAPWLSTVDLPRSTAMGGAHAAIATSNDALFVNPAGLSQGRRYHFELDGVLDPSFPAQAVTARVVDTTSAEVGSGLMFSRWASGQPEGRGEGWLLGLSYSSPVGQSLFLGGTTKYLRFHTPDGLEAKWAQDFGLLSRRGNAAWAVVLQNVALEKLGPLFPLTATAALAWGNDADWHLALDYKADLSDTSNIKHRGNGGVEFLIDQTLALRGGASWEPQDHQFWISAGFALLTEKGALQFAWRRQLRHGDDQLFEAGVTLFLE